MTDTTLQSFGDALRADRRRRRRLRARAAAIGVLTLGVAATIMLPPRPLLVWNASASAPIGLYTIAEPSALEPGDYALARLPEPYRRLAARRYYLPANVPLVKRVAAVAGDSVCASGAVVTINGRVAAKRKAADRFGRPLPWWRGCSTLRDAIFLLNPAEPASFDGRYFGPVPRADLIGKATPIWVR